MDKNVASFQKMIDVNIPIIYINDHDFVRVDALIESVIGSAIVKEWNAATGYTDFYSKNNAAGGGYEELTVFLSNQYERDTRRTGSVFLVLKEVHDYLDNPKVKTLLALMSQRKLYDRDYEKTVIIVSSVLKVPRELEKYISLLDIGLPDEQEINSLIDEHIEVNCYDKSKFKKEDRDKLMPSLKGMSKFDIDRTLDMAMSVDGSLSASDNEMILKHKKQMVRKSGVLELIDTPENLDSVGGVEVLKKYLERKKDIFARLPEAINYGVSVPKGIFLVGMPGCGKSLCAKATAAAFNGIPLLKMDMGSLMDKYVGESEMNMRKALKIAEAAAPCVLWIDEIEKSFSGVGGNNDIMTRMFGYFLSWMQEKKSAVYVFATANNAENLPPELKRKGRFDEIFCVNLPNTDERKAIFQVHINKKDKVYKQKSKSGSIIEGEIDYKILAGATKGFNGADIEAVVNEAVEKCFLENSQLTTEILIGVAKDTKSISKSCSSQIKAMEKLFKENDFKNASKDAYWLTSNN